jgi:N-acetylglucosaminyldiphosphoundecaprenol N-acetyl-beta-D-mannosaminyltransferase
MSTQNKFPKTTVFGVEVDRATTAEAVKYLAELAQRSSPAVYVVKPYSEFLARAIKQPKLKKLLNQAHLCLADGLGIQWPAYYFSKPKRGFLSWAASLGDIVIRPHKLASVIPERVAGTKFTDALLEASAQRGLRVFLVGTPKSGDIAETAQHLQKRFPGLIIAGGQSGRDQASHAWSKKLENHLVVSLRQSRADIVLIGLGFPLQEAVMSRLVKRLKHGVLVGEGGTFDFSSYGGRLRKAPNWVSRIGLEWLWRLAIEPRRLRRQAAIPYIMYKAYKNR